MLLVAPQKTYARWTGMRTMTALPRETPSRITPSRDPQAGRRHGSSSMTQPAMVQLPSPPFFPPRRGGGLKSEARREPLGYGLLDEDPRCLW